MPQELLSVIPGWRPLLQSRVCAGAWHVLPVPSSPGDTAASLQRGWAPVLAHWSNWFAGRKQRSCSRHDRRHIAVPSPPAWAALPSCCWKRLNWEYWEPEGQGHPGHRCAQLWQGVWVAVSSGCHLLAETSSQECGRGPRVSQDDALTAVLDPLLKVPNHGVRWESTPACRKGKPPPVAAGKSDKQVQPLTAGNWASRGKIPPCFVLLCQAQPPTLPCPTSVAVGGQGRSQARSSPAQGEHLGAKSRGSASGPQGCRASRTLRGQRELQPLRSWQGPAQRGWDHSLLDSGEDGDGGVSVWLGDAGGHSEPWVTPA